jgi:hypothetical protein
MLSNFLFNLKRLLFPIILVVLTGLSLWWLRQMDDAPRGLELVMYKASLVNLGFINAHVVRKLMFPYIHFGAEKEWSNNLLIIVIYAVCIYCFAMGG